MSAQLKRILPYIAGGLLLAFGGSAFAGECCAPKPPPAPPSKPCCAAKPPAPPPAKPGRDKLNVYVNVNTTSVAIANANANASANASGGSEGDSFFFGGGGSNVIATPGFPVIQALNVVGAESARKAFTEKRSVLKQVIVQAVCLDDRGSPHAASQLFPERDVAEGFSGEIYRCVAGSKLQVTIADFVGKVSFDGGETLACAKGEALWFGEGKVSCRPAKPQRNCFERSLLRRHGVGVKVFKMTRIEEFTSYREEVVQASSMGSVALDGGVGGFVH